jgi:ankyrin repeat protein
MNQTTQREEFLKSVANGDSDAVAAALLEDPSLLEERAPNGATAIQWAAYHGKPSMIDQLVAAGAEVDYPTACCIGRIDLIPEHADPDAMSADGFCVLALAAAFGHNDIVRLLLDRGANPNAVSPALGQVPVLQSAVFGRNAEAVRMLVEARADPNGRQGGGFTALMGAAQNGDPDMVKYLLAHGADPLLRSDEGKLAADYANTDEIRALVSRVDD